MISSYLLYPDWIYALLQKQTPNVLYYVETEQPVVALTIDDGPDPITTPKILDMLKEHNAQGTFFLISSRIPGNEAIVERIVAEGHGIGNHLTIDFPSIRFPPPEFERQLLTAHSTLLNFTDPRWFRPGSGWFNQAMLSIVDKYEYQLALGSVYPFDPQIPSSWFSTQYIMWNVKPGSVIILHDGRRRGERTVETLSVVLPELKQRGYQVVTLSELADLQTATESKGLLWGIQRKRPAFVEPVPVADRDLVQPQTSKMPSFKSNFNGSGSPIRPNFHPDKTSFPPPSNIIPNPPHINRKILNKR